ncbi:AAA family ATPase [Nesterenkonia sp. PF2B19]|uniref:AAA family ATPase n=1 Tax=Nesterenkonia sp. PF2B19 TaxID=1881858 RepID=UPI000872FC8F|nr:ParA family protein [Nesterenkonia sp. PF2B19]OSM44223.1 hypothetical protein BCY76_003450 [Nesterenkonia sp. PF2B19]
MRRCSVITAGHLQRDHIAAVEGLHGPVTIDRRCADLAELVAAARTGMADAVLIIGETETITGSLLTEFTEPGLVVVAVSDVSEERARLRALGIVALPDTVDAKTLTDALRGLPVPEQSADEDLLGAPAAVGKELDDVPVDPADVQAAAVHDSGAESEAPPGRTQEGEGAPGGQHPLDAELAELLSAAETTRSRREAASAEPTQEEHTQEEHTPDDRPLAAAGTGSARDDDAVRAAGAARRGTTGRDDAGPQNADLRAAAEEDAGEEDSGAALRRPGITTVWGAPGSPGRTTVAVNLAAELALTGARVLLIDADTVASSAATHLGLLEESAGLAQACRQADLGRLDAARLRRALTVVDICGYRLHLLTGLPRADRWPELRGGALRQVLQRAARDFSHVVVDVAAPTEHDEELTFDTRAPQRHAATITAVEEADTLLAVGGPDPVSFPRLVKALDDLRLNLPQAPEPQVLINQIRREAVGRAPEDQLREAWDRFGSGEALETFLPWDRAACDDALLTGRVLAESAPQSALRHAIADLAGATLPTRRRRLLRR